MRKESEYTLEEMIKEIITIPQYFLGLFSTNNGVYKQKMKIIMKKFFLRHTSG